MDDVNLTDHSAYRAAVELYRIALSAYRFQAARGLTALMPERIYCDQFIRFNFHPLPWSASSAAGQDWTQAHADAAYEEARRFP